jgi:hypothetical protein
MQARAQAQLCAVLAMFRYLRHQCPVLDRFPTAAAALSPSDADASLSLSPGPPNTHADAIQLSTHYVNTPAGHLRLL